jgi:HEAT repeat protein
VDPWVRVRTEDGDAIHGVLKEPKSEAAKLEAAQAIGILRYRQALPDVFPLLKSKDDALMLAALRAVETAGDKAAAQETVFLIRDLNERIHLKVIGINGVFRNEGALPDLAEVFARSRSAKSRAGALEAIAMIGSPESQGLLVQNLQDRDAALRAYAAEGLGRMGAKDQTAGIAQIFASEGSMRARLGQAFALVALGDRREGEAQPLTYLFNTLNSMAWKGTASAYLEELARHEEVRAALRGKIAEATNGEKIGLANILGKVGSQADRAALDALANDKDPKVAQEGLRAAKALNARLP